MALTLEITLYKNGEPFESRLFGGLPSAKRWADEMGAEGIEVYDVEKDEVNYYLQGGANAAWYVTSEKMFNRIMERHKQRA